MREDAVSKILNAAQVAARWHAKQRRKGSARAPYINHLLEVAKLVGQATDSKDPDLIIAALLHDAIEDQGVSRAAIAEQFGEDVATLGEEVSDNKSLPQEVRKRLQVRAGIQEIASRADPETRRQDQQCHRHRQRPPAGRATAAICAMGPRCRCGSARRVARTRTSI